MDELLEYFQVYMFQENVRYYRERERERERWERLGRISERGTENHKLTVMYFIHPTELGQLSGVAGILRSPLPEPEDSDASDQD